MNAVKKKQVNESSGVSSATPAKTWRIERSGRPCLSFEGELIAGDDGVYQDGVEQQRYHQLGIFRTADGKFVVVIDYYALVDGELDHSEAHVVAQSGVGDVLTDYCPEARCQCINPATEDFQRELKLVQWDLAARYREQVRRLLKDFAEFDETID